MFHLASTDSKSDLEMMNDMHALAMLAYEKLFMTKRTKLEYAAFIGFHLSQFGLMLTRPE